jgi:hypothetical protein
MEVMRAFTQFQLLVLILIVYWILETNYEGTFRWALRSYVLGMLGTIVLAIKTGAAIRAVQETRDVRFSATLGHAIDANMLAALAALAFLSAIYLFARDRSLFWRGPPWRCCFAGDDVVSARGGLVRWRSRCCRRCCSCGRCCAPTGGMMCWRSCWPRYRRDY